MSITLNCTSGKMSYLLATLAAVLLLTSEASGKTVTGLFKSEAARQQKGQFITKFMYQGNVDGADVLAAGVSFQL